MKIRTTPVPVFGLLALLTSMPAFAVAPGYACADCHVVGDCDLLERGLVGIAYDSP